MPYADKAKQTAYMLERQRKLRLSGRICEGCGDREATAYHQAQEKTRAIALCSSCKLALSLRISRYTTI